MLQSVKAHGGERKLLGAKIHVEFMHRWHVFYFKLEKVMSLISLFDFGTALYFEVLGSQSAQVAQTCVYA